MVFLSLNSVLPKYALDESIRLMKHYLKKWYFKSSIVRLRNGKHSEDYETVV